MGHLRTTSPFNLRPPPPPPGDPPKKGEYYAIHLITLEFAEIEMLSFILQDH